MIPRQSIWWLLSDKRAGSVYSMDTVDRMKNDVSMSGIGQDFLIYLNDEQFERYELFLEFSI
jgi:hypothetical protein